MRRRDRVFFQAYALVLIMLLSWLLEWTYSVPVAQYLQLHSLSASQAGVHTADTRQQVDKKWWVMLWAMWQEALKSLPRKMQECPSSCKWPQGEDFSDCSSNHKSYQAIREIISQHVIILDQTRLYTGLVLTSPTSSPSSLQRTDGASPQPLALTCNFV